MVLSSAMCHCPKSYKWRRRRGGDLGDCLARGKEATSCRKRISDGHITKPTLNTGFLWVISPLLNLTQSQGERREIFLLQKSQISDNLSS